MSLIRATRVIGVFLAVFLQLSAQSSVASGKISVRVIAPGVASAAGLLVVTVLMVPDVFNSDPRVFFGLTDDQGRLDVTNLPSGVYKVCIDPRYAPFVVSCLWSPPDIVHLTPQQKNATVNIALKKGVPIEIRLDDPDQTLPSAVRPQNKTDVAVIINTPLGDQTLSPMIADTSGRNYRILAPPSVAAAIRVVVAPQLKLVDQTGKTADPSGPVAQFPGGLVAPSLGQDTTQFLRFTLRKHQ